MFSNKLWNYFSCPGISWTYSVLCFLACSESFLFSLFWRLCKILACTGPIVRNSKHLLTVAYGNGIFPIWKNIFYLIILNQILTRFVILPELGLITCSFFLFSYPRFIYFHICLITFAASHLLLSLPTSFIPTILLSGCITVWPSVSNKS